MNVASHRFLIRLAGLSLLALTTASCAIAAEDGARASSAVTAGDATPPEEHPCKTDGCVFRKQAEFYAVFRWMYETGKTELCPSTDVWPQVIAKNGDSDYAVVCGDTRQSREVRLRVTNWKDESNVALELVGVSNALPSHAHGEGTCTSDGCVRTKNYEFDAIVKWMRASDECSSTVAWPTRIEKLNRSDYTVACGDASSSRTIRLRVQNPGQAQYPDPVIITEAH